MTSSERYLRLPDVLTKTGLARRTVYRRISAGTFPAQVKLGDNTVAWLESEIMAWMAAPTGWSKAA